MEALMPTWYVASPAMHQAILEHAPAYPQTVAGNRLRFIRSGASALPPTVMQALERVFHAPVIEAYGMSEAGIACNPLPPALRKPGMVGFPITEVAIMGPNDEVLGVGQTGEIVVRGACVTRGYENSPLETAERFRKGWFFTGDLGRFDTDGYLEVTGRRKEIINRGGRKVDPRQVEDLLCQHPSVSDAAAFPVPHPTLGDDLVAAVVLAANAATTPQHLRNHLFQRWAAYQVPSRILVVDTIPRGATGKLERLHLASRLGANLRTEFVAPKSALEAELADIFAEVLHVQSVGTNDNFYALGGDSLKIVELVLLLEERLKRHVSDDITTTDLTPAGLKTFLTTPRTDETDVALDCPSKTLIRPFHVHGQHETAGRLLQRITRLFSRRIVAPPDLSRDFELFHFIGCNLKGRCPPLFWCSQVWFECKALSEAIGCDQPLYGIRSGFPPNRSVGWRRMLGERYAKKIVEIQPDGPVMIGGNCSGAYVAWEIAQALLARDREVDTLFLMEATIMRPHPGRVVMLYGNESLAYNPFLAGHDLRPDWQSLYGSYDIAELPGNHGGFFEPQTVPALASILRRYLAGGDV
jgi:oxalate---CoA ligase